MSKSGWIGVDLDGTLAHYDKWRGASHVGEPIPAMVRRVRSWRQMGIEVRIFTARISPASCHLNDNSREDTELPIQRWCLKHLGEVLPVTHEKDMAMIELWDDRAVQVIPNTGDRADGIA